MGASRPEKLDRLIESVSRGERDLASIRDAKLREAVRVAIRMNKNLPSGLDALARARMRDRVLGSVHPRRPTFADRAALTFELLAKPTPYMVRGIAVVALCISLIAGATVASAETLPDHPLYTFKIAGEDLRLTLALNAQDRAGVQLSIAEHRLAEAEVLAENGRDDDTLVASSTYSQQIAEAAAELAELDELRPEVVALMAQLDERFNEQRSRVWDLATRLSANPATERAAQILAVVAAPTLAPGLAGLQRIAETAAGVAEDLAQRAAAPAPRASPQPRASRTAEVVRRNADQARAAADRAKAKGSKNKGSSHKWDRVDDEDYDFDNNFD